MKTKKWIFLLFLFPSFAFAGGCPTDQLGEKLACEWGFAIDIAVLFAYFLATLLTATSLLMLWNRTQNPNMARMSTVILTFISAGFMFSLGNSLELAQSTIFTNKPVGLSEYSSTISGINGSDGKGITALTAGNAKALIGVIMLIGIIYFIRGLYLLSRIGADQNVTQSKVFAHIFGGAACFNILSVSCGFASFFNISALCLT